METIKRLVQGHLDAEENFKTEVEGRDMIELDVNNLTEEELFSKYWEFLDGCNSHVTENFSGLVTELLQEGIARVSLFSPNSLIPALEAELGAVEYLEDTKSFKLLADVDLEAKPQLGFLLEGGI